MLLPKLYKVTTTGKIQEWEVEVVDNQYRSISGQQEGKKVTSKWTTVKKGKNLGKSNETTPEEQALKNAQSKWDKKRSREYTDNLEEVGNFDWCKPQLAKKWEDHNHKIDFEAGERVAIQPKLDGIRNLQKGDKPQSREGKGFNGIPHIQLGDLPRLDGELYNHNLRNDFEHIVHLVRQHTPTPEEEAESAELIEYWVYDLPDADAGGFEERWKILQALDRDRGLHPSTCESRVALPFKVLLCPTIFVETEEELDAAHQHNLNAGYEGSIIRRLEAPYKHGRSDSLLKRKPFFDAEYQVVDAIEGKGNRSGTLGKFICVTEDGQQFGCGISKEGGITMEELATMWKNRESYIGKMATVTYQNLTKKGIPRFPVFKAVRDYE